MVSPTPHGFPRAITLPPRNGPPGPRRRAPASHTRRRRSCKFTKHGAIFAALLVAALALVAAGCGGDSGGGAPEALPSSSCTGIEYEGDGDPDYIIASDLALQGSSRAQNMQIIAAIRYQLGQQ